MDAFTTPTVTISGPTYNYVVNVLTPHFFARHVVDTSTISGDLYDDATSLRNLLSRGTTMERATTLIKKMRPDLMYLLQEEHEETTGEATASTTTKKKGVRSTTITSNYDMEITAKHVQRAMGE